MPKLNRIGANLNAFTFKFDEYLLDNIRRVYNHTLPSILNSPKNAHIFAGERTINADITIGNHSFYVISYKTAPLLWISGNNDHTFHFFRQFFYSLNITEQIKELVDYNNQIIMYCGFYVVGNFLEQEMWHVDYYEEANAYTLITPLFALDKSHGNLLYRDNNGDVQRYSYKTNEAIIVGSSFLHTTEPYRKSPMLRVLLSLTFGTDKLEYWDVLKKTIGTQSKYLILPCGHQMGHCACLTEMIWG